MWPGSETNTAFALHYYSDVSIPPANSNSGHVPQSSFFSKSTFPCCTSHPGWYLGQTQKSDLLYWIFPWLFGYRSEVNVYERARVAGVLCQSVKLGWDQPFDFQRCNTQDSLQISGLSMDNEQPRDPEGSTLECGTGTFLDHNFPWCFIQEEHSCKLQNSCKENQGVIGEGNFQRAPDQK